MKDTIFKDNGKSKILRAPADMPSTFDAWRAQLIAGQAYMDVFTNTDVESSDSGITELGTALNKASLLTDPTAAALGLSGDPTVNNALYALAGGIINAEASRSGTVVAITGPENAAVISFVSPSAWTAGDTYTFNGSPISIKGLDGSEISNAWAAGVVVNLSLSEGNAYMQGAGGVKIATATYTGTGAASRTVDLPFAPVFALVFAVNVPFVTTDPSSPSIVKGYACAVLQGTTASAGAELSGAQLTVYNDADSVMAESRRKLNAPTVNYGVVLIG